MLSSISKAVGFGSEAYVLPRKGAIFVVLWLLNCFLPGLHGAGRPFIFTSLAYASYGNMASFRYPSNIATLEVTVDDTSRTPLTLSESIFPYMISHLQVLFYPYDAKTHTIFQLLALVACGEAAGPLLGPFTAAGTKDGCLQGGCKESPNT